jgi:putative ABC transport system substrate-binding protein
VAQVIETQVTIRLCYDGGVTGRDLMRAIFRIVALLCLSILAAPMAHAQQSGKIPRVGIIALTPMSQVPSVNQPLIAGFRDLGYEEGRNIAFEVRSAEGHPERLPDIAAELVALKVDVLYVGVCGAPLDAARQATKTIPIVVAACNADMIEDGIIASFAHPGGNVTGLSKMTPELTAKRLELLKEMVPTASHVAVLWDPGYSSYVADWQELRTRAQVEHVVLQPVEAHIPEGLEKAYALMVHERADAVLSFSDVLTYVFGSRVGGLALEHKLPLMSPFTEITNAGGLMSYGPSIPDMLRRAAGYVAKILKGANAGDLPIQQPTKFDMAINLKTAKVLGINVPSSLVARADEVIE